MRNAGSNAGSNAGILATRRNGDVLIADEPTHVELSWPELPTADGESIAVTWSASVCCVDSDADRALLAERYLIGHSSTLAVARVARDLSSAVAPAIRAAVAARSADEWLAAAETDLKAKIEAEVRAAAFAAGLAMVAPYRVSVGCPSREQARRVDETRERLADIAKQDQARAASLAELTTVITNAAGNSERAQRALGGIRLADPLDLLRATAIVDPAWSATTPLLWIAAGTRIARVDVRRPMLNPADAPSIGDSLGPIRSISAARVDDTDVLLVGIRDGVHVVSVEPTVRVLQSFRHVTGGEFGFNAACFLAGDRRIVATHSQAGIVSWSIDEPAAPAIATTAGRARSVIAVDDDRAVLLIEGGLASYSPGSDVESFAGNSRLISVTVEGRDGVRRRKLVREDPVGSSEARYTPAVAIEDEIDVGGVPRSIRALAAGGLEMTDVAGSARLPIGPASIAARSVVARPGFAAAVSVDRTRVLVMDLARPEITSAELNVSTALGSRIADVCFA